MSLALLRCHQFASVGSIHKKGIIHDCGASSVQPFHLSLALISNISQVTFRHLGETSCSVSVEAPKQNQNRKYAGVITSNTKRHFQTFLGSV